MKIDLGFSWVLTDEHPSAAKGKPVLVDLETCKVYHPRDRIRAVLAQQAVSLAVERKPENYFLPEEIHFISRFKEEDHESQSVRAGHMGNKIKHAYEEIDYFSRR
jgi:hypothetical protein